ncbi:MAG: 4-(cytidine 5'-diphospho)-2-C-methyl-D-erythritol kinase [Coraliomargaritaceae bacterium]
MSLADREICLHSPAKVNWMLSVHGPREDGFHELTSVVVALRFGDSLRVRRAEVDSLECTDVGLPTGPENLILRAAEVFRRRSGQAVSFSFSLEKKIPVGAGLGGGSGNAAVALQAMNELAGRPLDGVELKEAAAELGSDCIFFLDGRPAVMRGRGERVEPLPEAAAARLAGQKVLLFKPDFAVSTAWAYGRLRALGVPGDYEEESIAGSRLERFLEGGPVAELLSNNFEPTVGRKFVAIQLLLEDLQAMGVPCRMSGSGSCCFALPGASAASVGEIRALIQEAWGDGVFFVETSVC